MATRGAKAFVISIPLFSRARRTTSRAYLKIGDVHRAISREDKKGYSLGLISATWPAILTGKPSDRGKRLRTPMPLSPLDARSHWSFISTPKGETAS